MLVRTPGPGANVFWKHGTSPPNGDEAHGAANRFGCHRGHVPRLGLGACAVCVAGVSRHVAPCRVVSFTCRRGINLRQHVDMFKRPG
eukprot:1935896-Prymnesium_polylepis.1